MLVVFPACTDHIGIFPICFVTSAPYGLDTILCAPVSNTHRCISHAIVIIPIALVTSVPYGLEYTVAFMRFQEEGVTCLFVASALQGIDIGHWRCNVLALT